MAKLKQEIGYVCRRGHYAFNADPKGNQECGSKRLATIYVESDEDESDLFGPPFEEVDEETGKVWFSSPGYSREDYDEVLEECETGLRDKLGSWWRS